MKFKFKHQKFQEDAARAVVDVFRGQPKSEGSRYLVDPGESREAALLSAVGYANAPLALPPSVLRENLHAVQEANQLPHTDELGANPKFTVEMETGTGKTYTYIKTMYELWQHYGWQKFIIVVSSVAIREGVYKTFQQTQEHFAMEYGRKVEFFIYDSRRLAEIETFAEMSGIRVMIINIQAFNARGKDARRIRMKLDEFGSRRPIDVIAATRPIVIIDEPQSVEGAQAKKSLADLGALFTLRYSATPRELHNLVYRLDAIDAYNQKLVKKISVKGIEAVGSDATHGYLYLDRINVSKSAPTATIVFDKKGKHGTRKVSRTAGEGFRLYEQSDGLEEYRTGYTISRIDANTNTVTLLNGQMLHVGEVTGDVSEAELRRLEIHETIRAHLERERRLYRRGIKVLSLFFIDEVAKYRIYGAGGEKENGEYAQMFEEEYQDILSHFQTELGEEDAAYQQYLSAITPEETHEGYFSIDKKGRMVDSKLKRKETSSDDSDAYDLIMRDKERLLDLDPRRSPVRFIFSHSALKEGWDNPNVFQICALRQTASTTRRRQEVGRGMRLCVNQAGERMDEARLGPLVQEVNSLTVVAGESYAKYADALQKEIREDLADRPRKVAASLFTGRTLASDDGKLPPRKVDADFAGKIFISLVRHDYVDDDGALTEKYRTDAAAGTLQVAEAAMPYRAAICQVLATVYDGTYPGVEDDSKNNVTASVQKDQLAKKEFLGLWRRIHQKSVYTVAFDTEELVEKAVAALDARLHVQPLAFRVKSGTLGEISSADQLARGEAFVREVNGTEEKVVKAHAASGVRYDLLGKMAQATGLTRRTVAAILTRIREDTFANFAYHPEEFILKAAGIINEEKATAIIEHITYQPLEDVYETSIFTEAQAKGRLGANALPVEKSVFDYLIYDSENEKKFAHELESEKDVAVYVKLPSAFFIDTPVGHYNPDWAIAFREGSVKHIYFVAETKGSMESMELRAVEQAKISCAKKHFRAISGDDVRYDVVDSYEALRQLVACP